MEITTDLLLKAYAIGVFPMAESRDSSDLHWIDPERRGILPLDKIHIPRSLRKILRRGDFEIRCDSAFEQVVDCCAAPTPERPDTWINAQIRELYLELFDKGFAHSVECWQEGKLVGGLYGVSLGGAFFGESMFTREPNASKAALMHLAARLIKGGYRLLDTQFTTAHLSQFGTIEVLRDDYKARLFTAIQIPAHFPHDLSASELETFIEECRENPPGVYSDD